ncbi:hypothetical protein MLD38_018127 [Melastoma candidum]|uniref:Uncharacterized protein n=1 Tax=Melastoma candidum TaxID=119954 RepID=A0ACB9QTY5_9MYRT|nr:hypothetical protein MLD38_018127 [Melastoma candidum]
MPNGGSPSQGQEAPGQSGDRQPDPGGVHGARVPNEGDHTRAAIRPPARAEAVAQKRKEHPSYADVASMLKAEGAHIPGVVNPSQLVKWLHQ